MPKVNVGSVELCYEAHGDPAGIPTLLIMGLGMQLVAWDEEFVQLLVDRGHYVIRFDNRDVGESTQFGHLPPPNVMEALSAVTTGQTYEATYSLQDMAHDIVGLFDKLGLQSAHVIGVSMGGMIAQVLSLAAPERVRSLTSIMSTTGDRGLPPPDPQAMGALMSIMGAGGGPPSLESAIGALRALSSPGYPFDTERLTRRLFLSMQRGFSPTGVGRQFIAVLTSPPRGETLKQLRVPTLVIHGESDPLIPPACGHATANAIPGAKLMLVPGMGHDLPQPLFSTLATAIIEHTAAADLTRSQN